MLKTQNGVPYKVDGEFFVSIYTGRQYTSLGPLIKHDGPESRLCARLAGRSPTDREFALGGTADEPIQDRPFNVTLPPSMPSKAERWQIAADRNRQIMEEENLSHRQVIQRKLETEAAAEREKETAAVERQALLARDDVQAAIGKARLLQTRYGFKAGKRQTELDRCRECVELAMTGQFEKFNELHDRLHAELIASLDFDAEAENLKREVDKLHEAKAILEVA